MEKSDRYISKHLIISAIPNQSHSHKSSLTRKSNINPLISLPTLKPEIVKLYILTKI